MGAVVPTVPTVVGLGLGIGGWSPRRSRRSSFRPAALRRPDRLNDHDTAWRHFLNWQANLRSRALNYATQSDPLIGRRRRRYGYHVESDRSPDSGYR